MLQRGVPGFFLLGAVLIKSNFIICTKTRTIYRTIFHQKIWLAHKWFYPTKPPFQLGSEGDCHRGKCSYYYTILRLKQFCVAHHTYGYAVSKALLKRHKLLKCTNCVSSIKIQILCLYCTIFFNYIFSYFSYYLSVDSSDEWLCSNKK